MHISHTVKESNCPQVTMRLAIKNMDRDVFKEKIYISNLVYPKHTWFPYQKGYKLQDEKVQWNASKLVQKLR